MLTYQLVEKRCFFRIDAEFMSRYLFLFLFCSFSVFANPALLSGQLTGQQSALSATSIVEKGDFYQCGDDESARYCIDDLVYYQSHFYAEVTFEKRAYQLFIFAPYSDFLWTQIQLGFAKDRLQLAKVTAAEQTFDVKAQWRNVGDEKGFSALDKSLILFLNQIKAKPQQQIWLPKAQYLSDNPELSVAFSHDTQSIELRITRRLTLSPSE